MPAPIDRSMSLPHSRLRILALLHALLLPSAAWSTEQTPPPPTPELFNLARVEAGHSGMWYDPSRSGEGWMLEVRPNDEAVVYWFTFDDQGNPRWLNGVGQVHRGANGDEIHFDDLIAVHGPRFGPDYDREDAVIEHVGQARFRFLDCDHGEVEFDAYGQQGSFPLAHLTHTMGAKGCRPIHGTPGEPVQAYAGQSGSWYDPTYSGQGFTLGWMPNGDAALVWFTFDAHGQPYWLTGVGTPSEDRIVFDQLLSVRGGRFAEDFNPATVTRTPWGRMELTLECEVGQAHYVPTEPGFAEGQFNLHRLTRLESPNCPWVKPKLSDLYDFEWTELPIPAYTTPLNPVHFRMYSIADDGTVVGVGHWDGWAGIVRLRPGETEWEKLLEGGGEPRVTPDGKTIYAYRIVPAPPEERRREEYWQLMIWREDSGWQPLPGTIYPTNTNVETSQDGTWVVGSGYLPNDPRSYPWKWSEATGQITLPEIGEVRGGDPMGISNDGNTVFGYTMRKIGNFPRPVAILWQNESPPRIMRDASEADQEWGELFHAWACDAACKIIVGFDWFRMDISRPGTYSAWYYTKAGEVVYLPHPIPGLLPGYLGANDINRNGDLMTGNYAVWEASWNTYITEGWLWTQDTGSVDLRNILEGSGGSRFTSRWDRELRDASSNGQYLLFTGTTPAGLGKLHQYRAGVLHLIPRAERKANTNNEGAEQ